jgi:hypothetical protein
MQNLHSTVRTVGYNATERSLPEELWGIIMSGALGNVNFALSRHVGLVWGLCNALRLGCVFLWHLGSIFLDLSIWVDENSAPAVEDHHSHRALLYLRLASVPPP